MKMIFISIIYLFINQLVISQTIISGKISDNKGVPLTGANVALKNTYEGTSTDSLGFFSFHTNETGKQILVVSFIGYQLIEKELDLSQKSATISIQMLEEQSELNTVVITAGAFETGEIKKPIVLKPMDIATTPSAVGDIYGAFATLPGTQVVGNEGGLFVRGGEGFETKTYIDGLQATNPYMSKMPDLPTRCRFSPLLFSGTIFSTGGYSAEYGQALSSVVNLNTTGIAEKTQSGISLMSVGLNGSHTHRWDKVSISASIEYCDMTMFYKLVKPKLDWALFPRMLNSTVLFRQKIGKYGLLKIFGSANLNKSALNYNITGDSTKASLINLKNTDYYLNVSYSDKLTKKWRIKTGFSYTNDKNITGINSNELNEPTKSAHHRLTLINELNDKISLKIGEEISWFSFNRNYYDSENNQTYSSGIKMVISALYFEPEMKINKNFVIRTGIRSEYLSGLNENKIEPRISMGYKIFNNSQFSLAYGMFHQRPENQYLLYNTSLQSEKANHLIFNYQYDKENRIFRAEVYRKWYDKLIRYQTEYNPDPTTYNNRGNGYAQGFDLFWRDSKTINGLDYWVSYSFIDTKRNYRNYQTSLTPSFISTHSFSVVGKYFFQNINTFIGMTFMYASPKTWYNPFIINEKGDKTTSYKDLSLNIVWIKPLFGTQVVFLLNINNLPGFKNIYGYNYAQNPDSNGEFYRFPIEPEHKRFIVIGVFISILK